MTRRRSPAAAVAFLAVLPVAQAWNDCSFPEVGYFALDEGVGISYTYALAAMNGNMYSGGYTKGNFAFVGVTDTADVHPVASATLWGDTTSNVQNLYVAEVSSTGSMTKAWHFKGSAIQQGAIGHGAQTNSIDSTTGIKAMLDKAHIAVDGGFRQLLQLPDGTEWSSASRTNTADQVPFVMSIDVSSTQGVGSGTTGWAKLMDTTHPGGASVYSVHGDTSANMIVSYQGCASYNASICSTDYRGRQTCGVKENCVQYVTKLAAADGSTVWEKSVPKALRDCTVINDGSFYCGWSMSASDGTLDFGNGVTVVSESGKAGMIKFDTSGNAVWARATASTSFGHLAVSNDGTLLAMTGSPGGGSRYSPSPPAQVARIDTSNGNEGNILWTDAGGVGTHGFRGVEVTDDGSEVIVFGQITGTETLSDTQGRSTTLRSRGSYEVFVAAYDATDGTGKYAMDGGGTGMEYFFAMASDPDTHDVYIGGTSRSEYLTWGDTSRKNPMYNGQPGQNNPDTNSPVGSSKAITVQLKSTSVLPSCLNTCNSAFPLQASDVKSGHCYIDRHCYTHDEAAPYTGAGCMKCDSDTNKIGWSGPDTTNACFIGGMCVASGAHAQVSQGYSMVDDPCNHCQPATSTSAYTSVAGCQLPTTFKAACYEVSGVEVMSLSAMRSTMSALNGTIATQEANNIQLRSDYDALLIRSCGDSGIGKNETIAIITILSVMFVLVVLILIVTISKERAGQPIFSPITPVSGSSTTKGARGSKVSTSASTAA